jgi:hypothetical protein
MRRALAIALLGLGTILAGTVPAAAGEALVPTRYGMAVLGGMVYDPDNFSLGLLQGYALFDYDRVFFWHQAPDGLRLRVEGNLGLAGRQGQRAVASLNLLAFKYLDRFAVGNRRPYIEGGIGVIYTDFQVDDQGSRVNFNPQAGAGLEWARADGHALQTGVRLHHLSNAGLNDDNRGINSLLLTIGWLY